MRPMIFTITGPSCSGKTTLQNNLISNYPDSFALLRSDCTRKMREGEIDGEEYDFVTMQEFELRQSRGEYSQTVHFAGNNYGTRTQHIKELLDEGKTPLKIVEPGGVAQFRRICREVGASLFSIYVDEDLDVMVSRFIGRARLEDPSLDPYIAMRIIQLIHQEIHWHEEENYDFVFDRRNANEFEMMYALSRVATGNIAIGNARNIMPQREE